MTVDFSPTQPIFSSTSTTIFILFSTILGLVYSLIQFFEIYRIPISSMHQTENEELVF